MFDEFDENWLTIYKLDHTGNEVWNYPAEIVNRGENYVCVQAVFQRNDIDSGFVVFAKDDLMTEWFFSDRWYNIFRLQHGKRGALKGWYCNITRPAVISEEVITAEDLALDVFVSPAGEILLVDQEEFEALNLSPDDHAQALTAVAQIRQSVIGRRYPFDEIEE